MALNTIYCVYFRANVEFENLGMVIEIPFLVTGIPSVSPLTLNTYHGEKQT